MKPRKYRYFMGDFETTVYDGQDRTDVWASACVELYSEHVEIFGSIDETFDYLKSIPGNVVIYYHNLKFDGSFWLSFLLTELKFEQAYIKLSDEPLRVEWMNEKDMKNNTFKYSISDKGNWYTIIIKTRDKIIEIRDSLKLIPFSVKQIGESFGTKRKKLDMEYKGTRFPGCQITDEEKEYISNDVLVVKEALEIMFDEGHNQLTIGSCCLKEYKNMIGKEDYNMFFPNIYEIGISEEKFGFKNAGDYVLKSYRGGWCYLVKGKEGKIYKNGLTADVNSLYPSMMSSESGNRYPVGEPHFWKGNFIPDDAIYENRYFFVRIRTRFYIKPNKLPFIQIKHSFSYRGNESLETSDILNPNTGEYYSEYIDENGNIKSTAVEITFTMTDYYLFLEHYEAVDFQIISGCWFYSEIGLFDTYINKFKKIKIENKGAKKQEAKLFLNNLYGKMASSTNSSFKLAYVKENDVIGFMAIPEFSKVPGYIPVGSAITSYARNFTIRAAQLNYYGPDKRGFIYADTDSIHCDLEKNELKGVPVHPYDFCNWKLESYWDEAFFTRQKTYIEHVTHEDEKEVEPHYDIKCAGMPDKCKKLFEKSVRGETKEGLTEEEREFLSQRRTLEDFNVGLKVPGKLQPKRINGGIVLLDGTYEMR